MRLIDYLLLAIVAVCAVIAFRVWRRAMKRAAAPATAPAARNTAMTNRKRTRPSSSDAGLKETAV